MHPLILHCRKTILKFEMLCPGDRVVIAVSGGADSMALLLALGEIREEFRLSLSVAHVDHGLRPEGEEEASFVRQSAGKVGVPFFQGRANVRALQKEKHLNLQEAAREARYAFLLGTAREIGAARIALGHTADDQAESVLMRILRGAGTRGLSGIPPVRDGIFIRPLIEVWRTEVESFLQETGTTFLQDPSNASSRYLRNRIRRELLPTLENYNPRLRQGLVQMAEFFRGEEGFWRELMQEKFPPLVQNRTEGTLSLHLPSLGSLPSPLRLQCIRRAIEEVQGDLRRISLPHIMAVEKLLESKEPNRRVDLPRGLRVIRAYDLLIFSRNEEVSPPYELSVNGPGLVNIPEIGRTLRFELLSNGKSVSLQNSPAVAMLDFDDLRFPLTLRSFRAGDRVQPLGMQGEKKIQDLFVDCKIPAAQRRRIPLLFQADRLLWVAGLRIDHRSRVKPETRQVLRVELLENLE